MMTNLRFSSSNGHPGLVDVDDRVHPLTLVATFGGRRWRTSRRGTLAAAESASRLSAGQWRRGRRVGSTQAMRAHRRRRWRASRTRDPSLQAAHCRPWPGPPGRAPGGSEVGQVIVVGHGDRVGGVTLLPSPHAKSLIGPTDDPLPALAVPQALPVVMQHLRGLARSRTQQR